MESWDKTDISTLTAQDVTQIVEFLDAVDRATYNEYLYGEVCGVPIKPEYSSDVIRDMALTKYKIGA